MESSAKHRECNEDVCVKPLHTSGDAHRHSTSVNSAVIAVLSRRSSVTVHEQAQVNGYLWVRLWIDCIDVGDVMLYRAKMSVHESNAQ